MVQKIICVGIRLWNKVDLNDTSVLICILAETEWWVCNGKWVIFQLYCGANKLYLMIWSPLCIRTTHLIEFLYCYLTETMVRKQTCCSTLTNYHYFEPTSLCSYSLHAKQRSRKHQCYTPWFDPTEMTHDWTKSSSWLTWSHHFECCMVTTYVAVYEYF